MSRHGSEENAGCRREAARENRWGQGKELRECGCDAASIQRFDSV